MSLLFGRLFLCDIILVLLYRIVLLCEGQNLASLGHLKRFHEPYVSLLMLCREEVGKLVLRDLQTFAFPLSCAWCGMLTLVHRFLRRGLPCGKQALLEASCSFELVCLRSANRLLILTLIFLLFFSLRRSRLLLLLVVKGLDGEKLLPARSVVHLVEFAYFAAFDGLCAGLVALRLALISDGGGGVVVERSSSCYRDSSDSRLEELIDFLALLIHRKLVLVDAATERSRFLGFGEQMARRGALLQLDLLMYLREGAWLNAVHDPGSLVQWSHWGCFFRLLCFLSFRLTMY